MKRFLKTRGKRIVAFMLAVLFIWSMLPHWIFMSVKAAEATTTSDEVTTYSADIGTDNGTDAGTSNGENFIKEDVYEITGTINDSNGGVIVISDGDDTTTEDATGIAKNSKRTIIVTSNEGYEITGITIAKNDEAWKPEGEIEENWWDTEAYLVEHVENNSETFTYELTGIQADYSVNVTFAKKTFTVIYTIGTNGKLILNSDASNDAEKVILTSNMAGSEQKVEYSTEDYVITAAVSDSDYHLTSFKVKNGTDEFAEQVSESDISNALEEISFTIPARNLSAYTVEVTAAIDTYEVSLEKTGNGTVSVSQGNLEHGSMTVDAGTDMTFTLIPDEGNQIESLCVNGDLKNSEDFTKQADGSYQYVVTDIQQDYMVEVEFSNIGSTDFEAAGIVVKDQNGKEITPDENHTYYAESYTLSASGKNLSLQEYGFWNYSAQLKMTETQNVSAIYMRDTSNWFSSVEKVFANPELRFVVDTSEPVIDMEETYWEVADNTEVIITGSVMEDNLDYLVWTTEAKKALSDIEVISGKNRIVVEASGSFSQKLEISGNITTFYLYAVDKAGHYTGRQIVVYRDSTSPEVTEIEIVSPEAINKLSYGNFLNSALTLRVSAHDVAIAEGADIAAGIKEVRIYAESGIEPVYAKTVEYVQNTDETCTIDITIPAGETEAFAQLQELRIAVVDAVGNVSEKMYLLNDEVASTGMTSSKIMIENHKPVVVVTLDESGVYVKQNTTPKELWYSESPDISYAVSDLSGENMGSGLKEGTIALNNHTLSAYGKDYTPTAYSSENQTENETVEGSVFAAVQEGENVITVTFTDMAGNTGIAEQKIYIDTHAPEVTGFSIEKRSSFWDKVLNFLSFGSYANTELQITVTAEEMVIDEDGEVIPASGLDTITLKVNGVEYQTAPVSDGRAVFDLPMGELGENECITASTISAYATDHVGNDSSVCEMNTSNSNLTQNSEVMIETIEPVVSVSFEQTYVGEEGIAYNNTDTDFMIAVSDAESGIYSTVITINGVELVHEVNDEIKQMNRTYSVSTGETGVAATDEGKYILTVTVTDNAGNVKVSTNEVYVDETAPEILNIDMEAEGTAEADGTELSVQETTYGYYFREDTKVTIYATDGAKAGDCGVKSICYYTVNVDGTRSPVTTLEVNTNNEVTFTIPAEFKGQIYACAYDHLDNHNDYVTPGSLIIETAELHARESHISFVKEASAYTDTNNNEIYAGNVSVNVIVLDTFSGIRSVEWSVEAPYDTTNNQSGMLTIDNDGAYMAGSNTDGWSQTGIDQNLVTELQKIFVISNNSNDIVLRVWMTDRAGNTTEKEITFGIDKTIPVIEVAFDDSNADSDNPTMFNSDRVATITVTERNFNADDFAVSIANTDGSIPRISEWKAQTDGQNSDETKYVTTVTFSEDGDYTMTISGRDRVGNSAETVSLEEFTIDKTSPVIHVTYDNENALNGNYYSATRTATIQIEEHNFSENRVEVLGTATDNGVTARFPVISAWRDEGDVHTATITCDADGLYQFDVTFTDQAGNEAETYEGEEFYVDMTEPEIEIMGVEDMSANNGEVAPKISLSDTNYDAGGVTLELYGANRGETVIQGAYTNQNNGQIYSFQNFKQEQEYDDLYTLTATLVDLAGNESTETITFSVNRFGSVYIFDNSLKEIAGTYVSEEIDVKLTEINVDSLEHDTIQVIVDANGTPKTLMEGADYTVTEAGGNGTWYQYDYTLDSALFAGDGRYIVTLYSKDAAGNVNENIDETKEAEISFGVDKTAPVVVPINIESKTQYAVDVKRATVAVNDNLVLKDVNIYIGDEECEYAADGENYTFTIPSATERKDITVVAVDAAGNRTDYVISDVLVSTNLFVRWYNNTPLFVSSIVAAAGVGAAGIGGTALFRSGRITVRRKKK